MEVFDITQIYPELYTAKAKEVVLIEAPLLRTLAISGQGDPAGPRYANSVEALTNTVTGIDLLPELGVEPEGYMEVVLPPLECLWSMQNGGVFDITKKDLWLWELIMVVPGFLTQGLVERITNDLQEKKPNPLYGELHITTLEEKQAVQTLHLGSYENEAKDIELMQKLMQKNSLKPSARHHEVYLNSPADVSAAKLRTILRQPVVPI